MNYSLLCKVLAAPIALNWFINKYFSDEEIFIEAPFITSLAYSSFSVAVPIIHDRFKIGMPSWEDNIKFSLLSASAAIFSYHAINCKSLVLAIPATLLTGLQIYHNCIGAFSYFEDI